jgi:NADPH:quinone reductase-like Zn-dependent oxidoreductase
VQELAGLARSGALKPVIDRVFPFADAVDAHRLVDSGRKRGSVVLSLQDDP